MGVEIVQRMLCKTRARMQRQMATEMQRQVRRTTTSFKTEIIRSVDDLQDARACFHPLSPQERKFRSQRASPQVRNVETITTKRRPECLESDLTPRI